MRSCQVRFPIACLSTAASLDRNSVLMPRAGQVTGPRSCQGDSDGLLADGSLDASLSGSVSDCLLVDGRKLRSDLGFDAVCSSGYRPSILSGCTPDCVESRELRSELGLDAVCRSGYRTSILSG